MEKLRLKMDEVKAKGMFSLVVTVAKVVGPLIVLGLIIWVLFPKQPENPVPVIVKEEVPVTVEVEKPVVQTVVVEKEVVAKKEVAVAASPTPVPTPSKPSCPLRGKLADGKVIICLRCYSQEGGDKCDYRTEDMLDSGFYIADADKILDNLLWWEPVK